MKFRPCIDIHDGKVKQMVGGTIGEKSQEVTNFESSLGGAHYASLYKKDGLKGGHVIILDSKESRTYQASCEQGIEALKMYSNGLQIGGGITDENAKQYLNYGASHIIVTSFLFEEKQFSFEKLERLQKVAGKDRLVIDLSCRKKEGAYHVVTNRWQTFTQETISLEFLSRLSTYCDEFLIHGVDVEGKSSGMEEGLVHILSQFEECPITYAGGIGSLEDLHRFKEASHNKLDVTIGSALDIFGGTISYDYVKTLK